MTAPRVRILHETNPGKYFPALYELADEGKIMLSGAHRYSVVKEFIRAGVKDRTPAVERAKHAASDFWFRATKGQVQGETIVMGFAPWDWRILVYRSLAKQNRIIYHTSWHDWRIDRTPRQPRPELLKHWLREQWLSFVRDQNVDVVAVTSDVAAAVANETGKNASIIPHAVPSAFFAAGETRQERPSGPLRLLFVGEVSEKKGIGVLLELMASLPENTATLTVIGNGTMADTVKAAGGNVTFLGPIRDRARLAAEMARHDVLMLLSQRTPTWEELFGIVLVEALAAGLAVIASDHVGPRGILSPVAGLGLFAQDDVDGVAALLRAWAADPAALERAQRLQRPIADAFSVDAVMRRWEEVVRA